MGKRRTRWLALPVIMVLLAAMSGTAVAGDRGKGSDREVTVMSRNLYFGADLGDVVAAEDLGQFQEALQAAFFQALGDLGMTSFGSNPWARMDAVAGEIEATGAVLVGLQETAVWTVNGTVVADFAQLIIDALQDRGLQYEVVASQTGFQFAAPVGGFTAGLAISDVILARTDLRTSQLKLSNPQSGNYAESFSLPTPLGFDIPFPRQWVSIDAKVRGKEFRFVSTHLESVSPLVRAAQATELVTSATSPLNTTDEPVILVGDLNAEVGDQTFGLTDAADIILGAGFTDAWAVAGSGPGDTFGHDADLADPTDILEESRIDYVMYRGETVAETAFVVDTALPLNGRPLWPSDHGGVVVTLELKVK